MIARRLSADVRWVLAAAPSYLKRYGAPQHPDDLQHHNCLRFRLGDGSVYQWEFERGAEQREIAVPGALTLDDSRIILALLWRGAGLMCAPEFLVESLLKVGAVKLVMEDWASLGPGFHIYYSSRRQLPTGLRLLIELIRELSSLGSCDAPEPARPGSG